jgi:hypothetical protein
MKSDPAVERFIQLQREFPRPPMGSSYKIRVGRALFLMAQLEMFVLAQMIGRKYISDVQRELDSSRRDVMEELSKLDSPKPNVVKPYKCVSHIRWSDFQITPEVAGDANLTGKHVSKKNADRLRRAHRAQVQQILRLVKEAMG